MDNDDLNILIFTPSSLGIRKLRIGKETFKISFYILIFFQITVTLFLCDYVRIKKNTFPLNQLRSETVVQRSHIQLFSTEIEQLEKQISRLMDMDRRIHVLTSPGKGREAAPLIGTGGATPSVMPRPFKQQLNTENGPEGK